MTLEEIHKKIDKKAKSDSSMYENYIHILIVKMIVNEMFNYFEEELKKAYIEGGNDAWKARNESIEKAIVSVEDNYGCMTHEDKQNCIEILYGLMK